MDADNQGHEAGLEDPFRSDRAKGWMPPREPQGWSLHLVKQQGDVLGAGLGNTDKGAVIFNIQKNGLLDGWNRAQELEPLRPGTIITEVNGVTGYWDILEALRRPGVLDIKVTVKPPAYAGPDWFQDIAEIGKRLEANKNKSSFMLRLSRKSQFSSLPRARAADCDVDQCAICMDGVAPDEQLAQLPCGHAFHGMCVARWLTGKCRCCPLCCRKVVCSPSGGNVTADAEELDR